MRDGSGENKKWWDTRSSCVTVKSTISEVVVGSEDGMLDNTADYIDWVKTGRSRRSEEVESEGLSKELNI